MTDLENLFILIAEDDLDDAQIIQRSFAKHPAFTKINLVKNGQELLDYLKAGDSVKPDVILSDINMPKLNGIEVLENVFDDSKLCGIPFFIYSSSNNAAYEKKCKEYGAKAFILKPFDLAEFDEIPYEVIYCLKKDQQSQKTDDSD